MAGLACFDGSRCKACLNTHRCVPGDGDTPCPIMFIGERPGQDENISGRPFTGRSGEEFNYGYLPRAGLNRDDIYLTNSTKCASLGNRKPSKGELTECSQKFIPHEIEACDPQVIVLMGSTACSLAPEIELKKDHGILRDVWMFGQKRWVFPVHHPAAGMHNTSMMIPLLTDFEVLGNVLKGTHEYPVDTHPDRVYSELHSVDEIDQIFDQIEDDGPVPVGVDTEADGPRLWSFQFSTHADNGYFIKGDKTVMLKRVGKRLRKHHAIIQNDLYDLAPLDEAGIFVHRVVDPMKVSYHLGDLPQGLKELAWRLCGVRMRSYEDVVKPHSRRVMVQWLQRALEIVARDGKWVVDTVYKKPMVLKPEHNREEYQVGWDAVKKKEVRLALLKREERALTKDLNRIITHTEKPIDPDAVAVYDPWKKLVEIQKDKEKVGQKMDLELVVKELGDPPIESIVHVSPFLEALHYACEDANMCPRVLRAEDVRCRQLGERVVPSDYDR